MKFIAKEASAFLRSRQQALVLFGETRQEILFSKQGFLLRILRIKVEVFHEPRTAICQVQ